MAQMVTFPIVGVDRDRKNRFRLLKAFFNGRLYGEVDTRETKNGFHLRVKGGREFTVVENMHIRLHLCDCKGRMAYDDLKLEMGLVEMFDTLFESKQGIKDNDWTDEEPINPLAEPFWVARMRLKRRRWNAWQRANTQK